VILPGAAAVHISRVTLDAESSAAERRILVMRPVGKVRGAAEESRGLGYATNAGRRPTPLVVAARSGVEKRETTGDLRSSSAPIRAIWPT